MAFSVEATRYVDTLFEKIKSDITSLPECHKEELYRLVGITAGACCRPEEFRAEPDLFVDVDILSDGDENSPVSKKKPGKEKKRSTKKPKVDHDWNGDPTSLNGEAILGLSVKQLKEALKTMGVKGISSLKKDDLQDKLTAELANRKEISTQPWL